MAKNTTRKSLAIGAAFALSATGLVSSPAFAADLSLSPSAGSTYNVFLSDSFILNSAITGNTNIANTGAWKWEVVNTSGVTVAVSGTYWDETLVTPAYVDSTLTTSSTGTTKVYSPGAGKVTDVVGKVNTITLNPTTDADTATFSVTVRSFSDLDASGSVTAGDLVSDARTITFHKGSEVTGTVVLDEVYAGVAPTATLTFDKGINLEQITLANVTRTFTVNGTEEASGAVTGLNTAKTGIVLTAGANAAAGQIISAKGLWKRYDGDTTLSTASSATRTVSAASTGDDATLTLANSANVATAVAGDFVGNALVAAGADANLNKIVRAGTKSISFKVAIVDVDDEALAAGAPVTVDVAETGNATLAAGTVITAGGKELTNAAGGAADSITYYTSTDATGAVTVTIASDDATAGDELLVTVTSNNATAKVGLVWKTAAIDDVYVTNDLVGDTERTLVKGGSTTINYLLVDQFRQPWTRTNYQYRLTITPSGTATAPSPVVLTNGAGTLNWVDNSTAASGAYNLVAAVQEQTGNGGWAALAAGAEDVTTVINIVASAPAASAIATATAVLDDTNAIAATGVPLADKTLAAIDRRVDTNTVSAIGVTAGKGAKLVATVTSSTGANVKGASVTVSASGLYFATDAGANTYVSKDSITLNTATNGTVTVYVYSQKAGKQTITFTSGSVTKTQAVTWASAAAADGKTLTVSAPAAAGPGTTFKVTGKLVDKYGNPVKMANTTTATDPTLSVSYAGPGLVSGSLPTSTDANGEFFVYVLLGANDTGTATLTASYDADGTTATIAAITASTTITVGSVATAKVNVGSFNGKLVVYANGYNGKKISWKVGGKWGTAVATSDTARFARVTPRKGVTVSVQIYVDGVKTLTKSVVTK